MPRKSNDEPVLRPGEFPTIAYVVWRDAHFSTDEVPLSEISDLVELHEIGWLVSETDETLTLTMEYQPGVLSTRLYLTIPKVNIVSVYYLRPDARPPGRKGTNSKRKMKSSG